MMSLGSKHSRKSTLLGVDISKAPYADKGPMTCKVVHYPLIAGIASEHPTPF